MPDNAPPDVVVRRAYQIYLYAVCFVAVLVLLFGSATAVYGLVRVVAPGATAGENPDHSIERDEGIADLLQNGILALAAFGVFMFHWRRSQELRSELERLTGPPPGAPMSDRPPPPPPPDPTPATDTAAPSRPLRGGTRTRREPRARREPRGRPRPRGEGTGDASS